MRYLCFLAVLLMLPVTATAQQASWAGRSAQRSEDRQSDQSQDRRSDRGQGRRADRGDERRSSSNDQHAQNSFLPPIGLPPAIPNNRMPWWEQQQTPWWERQSQPAWERQQVHQPSWARDIKEAQDRRLGKTTTPRPRRHQPVVIYVLPSYGYFPTNPMYGYGVSSSTTYVTPPPSDIVTMYPPAPEPPPAEITTGFLRLEVEPRGLLQVFVDGLYVGSLADLGSEIELRLGTRRIELRAPGYRTLTFNTEIVPDRTIVYRGALEPANNVAAAPPAPAAASGASAPAIPAPAAPADVTPSVTRAPRTIYLIPGCYMGNVAPKEKDLRPGCDINSLQKIEP